MPALVLGKDPQDRVQDVTRMPWLTAVTANFIYWKEMSQALPVSIRQWFKRHIVSRDPLRNVLKWFDYSHNRQRGGEKGGR